MKYLVGLIVLLCIACKTDRQNSKERTIVLQPFEYFPESISRNIQKRVQGVNPNVELRKNIPFPKSSYYSLRNRYRADSIIRYLKNQIGENYVIVGLTNKDISTTKNDINDWGVMGLGYRPGNSCVVSTFRLKNKKEDQFYKVILHELGHTEGLPHCKEKTCFIRDAEGGNPLDEEFHFCKSCSNYLESKGWKLTLAYH